MPRYRVGIHGVPEVHVLDARNAAQARYFSWRAAREAGYRVSFLRFLTEWLDFVTREPRP